jgi:hypothetical protein
LKGSLENYYLTQVSDDTEGFRYGDASRSEVRGENEDVVQNTIIVAGAGVLLPSGTIFFEDLASYPSS